MSREDIAEVVSCLRHSNRVPPELVDQVVDQLLAAAEDLAELGPDEVPVG